MPVCAVFTYAQVNKMGGARKKVGVACLWSITWCGRGLYLVNHVVVLHTAIMMAVGLVALLLVLSSWCCVTARNFTIDYENDTFLKDGEPFRQVSPC